MDHEIAGDDAFNKIADTLEDFLCRLQPFDTLQAAPVTGTKGISWINPDFLKSLKPKS